MFIIDVDGADKLVEVMERQDEDGIDGADTLLVGVLEAHDEDEPVVDLALHKNDILSLTASCEVQPDLWEE